MQIRLTVYRAHYMRMLGQLVGIGSVEQQNVKLTKKCISFIFFVVGIYYQWYILHGYLFVIGILLPWYFLYMRVYFWHR